MGELRESLSDIVECGLPTALEAMGERWSFMILRGAFNGVRHFEEFLSEIGIARNILANRLTRLTECGILHRTPCPDDRRKVEYRLSRFCDAHLQGREREFLRVIRVIVELFRQALMDVRDVKLFEIVVAVERPVRADQIIA